MSGRRTSFAKRKQGTDLLGHRPYRRHHPGSRRLPPCGSFRPCRDGGGDGRRSGSDAGGPTGEIARFAGSNILRYCAAAATVQRAGWRDGSLQTPVSGSFRRTSLALSQSPARAAATERTCS